MFFAGNCENKKGLLGLLSLIGGGNENSSKDGNSGDGGSSGTKAPTNILLSKITIAEEQAKGTEIGTLIAESGTKPYTYELVAGTVQATIQILALKEINSKATRFLILKRRLPTLFESKRPIKIKRLSRKNLRLRLAILTS